MASADDLRTWLERNGTKSVLIPFSHGKKACIKNNILSDYPELVVIEDIVNPNSGKFDSVKTKQDVAKLCGWLSAIPTQQDLVHVNDSDTQRPRFKPFSNLELSAAFHLKSSASLLAAPKEPRPLNLLAKEDEERHGRRRPKSIDVSTKDKKPAAPRVEFDRKTPIPSDISLDRCGPSRRVFALDVGNFNSKRPKKSRFTPEHMLSVIEELWRVDDWPENARKLVVATRKHLPVDCQHIFCVTSNTKKMKNILGAYYDSTPSPMDLSQIRSKVEGREYTSFEDFAADLNLCATNALKFFDGRGPLNEMANHFSNRVTRALRRIPS